MCTCINAYNKEIGGFLNLDPNFGNMDIIYAHFANMSKVFYIIGMYFNIHRL